MLIYFPCVTLNHSQAHTHKVALAKVLLLHTQRRTDIHTVACNRKNSKENKPLRLCVYLAQSFPPQSLAGDLLLAAVPTLTGDLLLEQVLPA
jgi:hypothetical protein